MTEDKIVMLQIGLPVSEYIKILQFKKEKSYRSWRALLNDIAVNTTPQQEAQYDL